MTFLFAIGQIALLALFKVLSLVAFSIPAGFGLGIGFALAKRYNRWRDYKKAMKPMEIEKQELADLAEAVST